MGLECGEVLSRKWPAFLRVAKKASMKSTCSFGSGPWRVTQYFVPGTKSISCRVPLSMGYLELRRGICRQFPRSNHNKNLLSNPPTLKKRLPGPHLEHTHPMLTRYEVQGQYRRPVRSKQLLVFLALSYSAQTTWNSEKSQFDFINTSAEIRSTAAALGTMTGDRHGGGHETWVVPCPQESVCILHNTSDYVLGEG